MSWELAEANRVQVVILSVETTTVRWALGLRRLQVPGPEPIVIAGQPFDHARNTGCQIALDRGCEYVFHLDSDVVTPPDVIHRLIARRKPVISGVYCRRSPPQGVPVMMRDGQWVTDLPGPGEDPVISVDMVGAGCLLIHRSVLEQMAKKCPLAPGKPWFYWKSDLAGMVPAGEATSEDFSFCNQLRLKMGVPVLVDTSVRCKHLGTAEADYGSYVPAPPG